MGPVGAAGVDGSRGINVSIIIFKVYANLRVIL